MHYKYTTVQVFHKPVEMLDIHHAFDNDLETILVSQQLCELPHASTIQAFKARLVEKFLSLVMLATFLGRALLEIGIGKN
ncbi:hypothetical protein TNCV_4949291 [Trichonephila clavipes]|nr:hypothetical protein TNCV_4949291 [Trichonephila clavipes]